MLLAAAGGLLVACGGDEAQPRFPIVPSDDLAAQGQAIYQANCQSCHGDAQGQGRIPQAPPHNAQGHTWHHADRLLFEWVLDRPPLATLMPAFRGTLTEVEVIAVLAYIKTMWPEDIRQMQIEGSQQYERQFEEEGG